MPDKPKTQHRSVRINDANWADLETAADPFGLDRSKVINELIEWWLRRPGAKLPERPSADTVVGIVNARLARQDTET